MPHELNLWHAPECPYCMHVRIVLAEKDLHYVSHVVSLDDVGPEVRARNPKGDVPVLQHHGCSVYESDVIAQYVEDAFEGTSLLPPEADLRARAQLLIRWADAVLVPAVAKLEDSRARGRDAREPVRDGVLQDALHQAYAALRKIGTMLGDRRYILGELSLVDVFLAPFVTSLDRIGLRTDELPQNVVAWIARLRDRPAIAGEVSHRIELLGLSEPDELLSGRRDHSLRKPLISTSENSGHKAGMPESIS